MAQTEEHDVERRALLLFERLSERPKARARILARESAAVLARVAALEANATHARYAIPTAGLGGVEAAPPGQVGPFRIVRRLGSGGMGSVWLGERSDGLYEQSVAVKFLHAEMGAAAEARFAEERRFLARLDDPAIARLIDGGVAEGRAYLVMEYVDGAPIDEACARAPLAERLRLFTAAAEAVQFAHSRLVVHADLKTNNILVDTSGRVRLLDFGIARLAGGRARKDRVSPMTRAFASPERRAGGEPSIADDIYALGMILGGLLSEARDPDLAAIADKAVHEEPERRYGSVAALLADLQRWRERLPVTARPPTLRYRAGGSWPATPSGWPSRRP